MEPDEVIEEKAVDLFIDENLAPDELAAPVMEMMMPYPLD